MMHTTDSGLDVAMNNPWIVILVFGALAAIIYITAAPYRAADSIEGNRHGRPHARVAAERGRVRHADANLHSSPEDVRGARADEAHDHRVVGGRAGSSVRAEHDRQPGSAGNGRLALTDDEALALARFAQLGTIDGWTEPELRDLASARRAIFDAANVVLNERRAGRR